MIAQWENECISLSVLSVVRVMVAQWGNEYISLYVLPVARVMIAIHVIVGIYRPQFKTENNTIQLSQSKIHLTVLG